MTSNWQKRNALRRLRRTAIFTRDNFRCVFCEFDVSENLSPSHPLRATIDHLEPQCSEHNTSIPINLVTCCRACNTEKGCMDWEWFIKKYGLISHKVHERIMNRRGRKIIGWNNVSKLEKYIEGCKYDLYSN